LKTIQNIVDEHIAALKLWKKHLTRPTDAHFRAVSGNIDELLRPFVYHELTTRNINRPFWMWKRGEANDKSLNEIKDVIRDMQGLKKILFEYYTYKPGDDCVLKWNGCKWLKMRDGDVMGELQKQENLLKTDEAVNIVFLQACMHGYRLPHEHSRRAEYLYKYFNEREKAWWNKRTNNDIKHREEVLAGTQPKRKIDKLALALAQEKLDADKKLRDYLAGYPESERRHIVESHPLLKNMRMKTRIFITGLTHSTYYRQQK